MPGYGFWSGTDRNDVFVISRKGDEYLETGGGEFTGLPLNTSMHFDELSFHSVNQTKKHRRKMKVRYLLYY